MGNPAQNTPAYFRKLEATKQRKAKIRHAKFLKDRRVTKLARLVRKETAAKYERETDALRRRSNAHMMKANKADGLRKQNEDLKAENKDLQAEVKKLRNKFRARANEAESLEADLKHTQAELKRWLVFWDWVKVHSREGTLRWLERLWKKGPKRAPDRCWGGGQ